MKRGRLKRAKDCMDGSDTRGITDFNWVVQGFTFYKTWKSPYGLLLHFTSSSRFRIAPRDLQPALLLSEGPE
ncbi:MAG TPA: hypothetical protein VGD65_20210 [Chryseosolibacter sp.]